MVKVCPVPEYELNMYIMQSIFMKINSNLIEIIVKKISHVPEYDLNMYIKQNISHISQKGTTIYINSKFSKHQSVQRYKSLDTSMNYIYILINTWCWLILQDIHWFCSHNLSLYQLILFRFCYTGMIKDKLFLD